MAYYFINFIGLRSGSQYQLRIAKAGNDNAKLTGAAVPFVTEEDDDDDIFMPVRLHTGYMNFIDETGDTWRGLISTTATDKAVTLYRGNDVVWEGFVQPGGMTSEYALRPQVVQVPVMCKLSALEAFDVEPTAFDIPSFGEMLHYILGKVGGFRYVAFQGGGSFVEGVLTKRVNHELFVGKDVDGNDISNIDCLSLLERICEFWGWAAHVQGQDLFFLSPDDALLSSSLTRYQYADLADVEQNQPEVLTTESVVFSESDYPFVSRENMEEIVPGKKKVTVTADISASSTSLEFPLDKIGDIIRWESGNIQYQSFGSDPDDALHHFWKIGGVTNYDQESDYIEIDGYRLYLYDDRNNAGGYLAITDFYQGDLQYKHEYDFTPTLVLYAEDIPLPWYARLESDRELAFSYGAFWVGADVWLDTIDASEPSHGTKNAQGYLVCRLSVGDDWWNGSGWGHDNTATFQIPIGGEHGAADGNGKIISTKHYTDVYEFFDGYGMEVNGSIHGKLFFEVKRVVIYGRELEQVASVNFSNIRFGFANNVNRMSHETERDNGKNVYVKENTRPFTDEVSIDTLFASDNFNKYGIAVVMNGNYTKLRTMQYGNANEHPEKHLADRIAGYYSSNARKLSFSVGSHVAPLGIADTVEVKYDDYMPISIGHEWRDETMHVTLMEK